MTDEIRNSYAGKRILVTGGAGYLATNLIGLLMDADCEVVRLGRSKTEFIPPSDHRARLEDLVGDVRERAVWERALAKVDIVFHFAAQTSVYVANEDPQADLNNNVLPMLHLLEVCRHQRRQPIVLFAGTVTEAGIPTCLPVDETHDDHPITVYDLHKLMAENYLKYYTGQAVVRGAVLRLANVYGPGPRSSAADRGVLNLMIRRALAGETLTVYGKGEHLRDYVYVEDVANAFIKAAANIDQALGRHFVIGSGSGHTITEALNLVSERAAAKNGKRALVTHIDPPTPQSPIEARSFIADSTQFTQITGWRPRWSLVEGIDRTIEAFL